MRGWEFYKPLSPTEQRYEVHLTASSLYIINQRILWSAKFSRLVYWYGRLTLAQCLKKLSSMWSFCNSKLRSEQIKILLYKKNYISNGACFKFADILTWNRFSDTFFFVIFLFQILQLLSSEDLWMYAPIAYNGMDIGLDHLKVTAPWR
jgi:hypothetical protein